MRMPGDNAALHIAPLTDDLRPWAARTLTEVWGSPRMVTHGHLHQADELPGFVALAQSAAEPVGLLTYAIAGDACEIVTLNSLRPDAGVGTALIEAVRDAARAAGCVYIWLVTTNDNVHALRFYQRRGFRLAALRAGAVDAARLRQPNIPLIGFEGIPLHDEIELTLSLCERSFDHGEH